MRGRPSMVIAGCFAMASFAVSIIAGLGAGNSTSSILMRAVGAMLICYPVGLMIGLVCERVVQAHLDAKRAEVEAAAPEASRLEEAKESDAMVV